MAASAPTAYRIYGKWFNRGPGAHGDGADVDEWELGPLLGGSARQRRTGTGTTSRPRAFNVPAYATSDLRLAWHVSRQLTMEVVGKNLHEASHLEFDVARSATSASGGAGTSG